MCSSSSFCLKCLLHCLQGFTYVIFKLLKAFDRTKWSYLKKVVAKFGIGVHLEKWLDMIDQEQAAVLGKEGQWSDRIKITRRVRQGCPLLLLIFNLGLELLAIVIRANRIRFRERELKISLYAEDVPLYLGNPV